MKSRVLAFLLATVCCVVVPINGQSTRKNSSTRKTEAGNAQPPKINSVNVGTVTVAKLTVQQQSKPAGEADNDGKESKPYLYRLVAPENLPNLILCIVGCAGIVVAACTLKAIQAQVAEAKGQTPSLKKAAEAAAENANALINAERAWVIPEFKSIAKTNGIFWAYQNGEKMTVEDILAGKHLVYLLKLTNMGRTPAQVISFQIAYTCLGEGVTDLPPNAAGNVCEYREFIKLLGSEPVEITDPVIEVSKFIAKDLQAIRNLEKTAVFHGWVKYRNMFSKKDCFADFCYVYTVSRNTLSSVGRHTGQREEEPESPNQAEQPN
jgi:hypothetical protein